MRMVNKRSIVFSCIFSTALFSAQAVSSIRDWGRVNMQGAIIDAACTIAVSSREQTVDMGVIALSDIVRDGQNYSKPFYIELVNCLLHRVKKNQRAPFQITFDGDKEGNLFSVHGEASGIDLQIIDRQGNIVLPGKALPFVDITPGNARLNYTMKLVKNNNKLIAGNYFSLIRFRLDYF